MKGETDQESRFFHCRAGHTMPALCERTLQSCIMREYITNNRYIM